MNIQDGPIRAAGQLKRIGRTGWVRVGVAKPESVADHSYRVALMAMMLGDELGLDTGKLVRMALVHDLPEAVVGDITPGQMSTEEKEKRELEAMRDLAPEGDLLELFKEYLAQETPEAQTLRQLDKLEMAIQAREYESVQDIDLSEFMDSARAEVSHERLVLLLERL